MIPDKSSFSVIKLYRDCLRLADYISTQGGSRAILRDQVRQAFKKNKEETDPQKIEEQKEAAIRGLSNYMFHEATPAGPRSLVPARRLRHGRVVVAAAAGPRSSKKGGSAGRSAAPVAEDHPLDAAAAAGLADERQQSKASAAALSEQQQQQLDALAEAISERLGALADSDDWSPDQMVLDADLEGFVEFGADVDEVAAAQRRLRAQAGSAAGGLELSSGESEEPGAAAAPAGRRSRRTRLGPGGGGGDGPQVPDELLPKVAIVGRPNVGKSALFNRIIGQQVAIVFDYPGVTRDRLYTRAFWGDREFLLIDTGGLMSDAEKLPKEQQEIARLSISAAGLPGAIERQAAAAVDEAAALIFVVDGQTGSTSADDEILAWLRRTHPDKPVVLAVNKCENAAKADLQAAEFWSTGLEPFAVSAISGSGTGELMERLKEGLPEPPTLADAADVLAESETVSLAIIGRPNVGKSSLLNSLVGSERSIVSSMAGTTRDAIDTDLTLTDGRKFKLVDTAGVRKRTAVASSKDGAEPLSVERAFRAVRRSEVAVLVLDAAEGVTTQDFRLAEYIAAEGRACVIAVNKWDTIAVKTDKTLADYEADVRAQLRPIDWANIVFISAKTGQRVKRVLDAATAASEEHRRRVTTSTLNLVLREAQGWRMPALSGSGKRGRIYYGTQAGIKPPTFVLFCNDTKLFHDDYKKFIERQFRENVGFPGSPLRLFWRGKQGRMEMS
ncbi:GTPase Der [Micractinium conductrix]|uniref:GTPase Der n=1 Tax=Micractinium conductrix TaxID=554055 RepID=A0A2P6V975_9CHLO|nr:GTPase Der [Micractinium conductrix]|eukprot:PSC70640.1 GTPase Der [Micractinium conductrix]